MVFCSKCGNEESDEKPFCSKCGSELNLTHQEIPTKIPRSRSNWWYILAIILIPIGGIIAYFAIRKDDPGKAKNILFITMILFGVYLALGLVVDLVL